jgi:hypothetical protein
MTTNDDPNRDSASSVDHSSQRLPADVEANRQRLAQLVGELLANHWLRQQSALANDATSPETAVKQTDDSQSSAPQSQLRNSRDS